MTPDEIENMTAGHKMDAYIGIYVFGYEMCSNGFCGMYHLEDGTSMYPKDWSTDISAAWEVHRVMCNPNNYASDRAMLYYGYLQRSVAKRYSGGSPVYPYILGFIEPIDICRAALLAVMEDVK